MALAALARKLKHLEATLQVRRQSNKLLLDQLRTDPAALLAEAGLAPDAWQQGLLATPANQSLVLCSRQAGKSTVAAALALRAALLQPGAPILLLSPSQRQSGELFRKVLDLYRRLERPLPAIAESASRLELANGSRILSLPGTEATVRGFSGVSLLIVDEAARVADPLYYAVRPMLAVSKGKLVALSTPFGKRGWFHDEWHSEGAWQRVKVTAAEVPRIDAAFLAEERRALGERWFRQEYECSFEEVVDAVFAYADIQAALCDDVKPLFGSG